jgi:hypothetical protein
MLLACLAYVVGSSVLSLAPLGQLLVVAHTHDLHKQQHAAATAVLLQQRSFHPKHQRCSQLPSILVISNAMQCCLGVNWLAAAWCFACTGRLPVHSHPGRRSSQQLQCRHVRGPCCGRPRGRQPPIHTWHSLQLGSSSSVGMSALMLFSCYVA